VKKFQEPSLTWSRTFQQAPEELEMLLSLIVEAGFGEGY
jgi:hypothetical protein